MQTFQETKKARLHTPMTSNDTEFYRQMTVIKEKSLAYLKENLICRNFIYIWLHYLHGLQFFAGITKYRHAHQDWMITCCSE